VIKNLSKRYIEFALGIVADYCVIAIL